MGNFRIQNKRRTPWRIALENGFQSKCEFDALSSDAKLIHAPAQLYREWNVIAATCNGRDRIERIKSFTAQATKSIEFGEWDLICLMHNL